MSQLSKLQLNILICGEKFSGKSGFKDYCESAFPNPPYPKLNVVISDGTIKQVLQCQADNYVIVLVERRVELRWNNKKDLFYDYELNKLPSSSFCYRINNSGEYEALEAAAHYVVTEEFFNLRRKYDFQANDNT